MLILAPLLVDAATCRILRSRARFIPVRDRAGNPALAPYPARIVWTLPETAAPKP